MAHRSTPSAQSPDDGYGLRAILADIRGFLRYLGTRLVEDRCQQSAAALTYVTLFALVPLITVFYTILSVFPTFQSLGEQVQALIFDHFVPSTGAEIQHYLANFAEKARGLTLAGTLLLLASAYLMLKNIEKAFNQIWRVRQHRRGMASFLLYWAVLSLGPLLIGAALLISTYLFSLSVFTEVPESAKLKSALLGALPALLSFATFTLIFAAVPNCRVPLRHAALGGAVTTVLFQAVKSLFAWTVSIGSYQLIYGTFAALPLFLLWVYLSWLMLLVGAEFVYALSTYRSQRELQLPDLLVGLAVLEETHRRMQDGGVLQDADILRRRSLFGRISVSPPRWEIIRAHLLDHNLLRGTDQGGYVLGTDLGNVSLWSLYTLLDAGREPGATPPPEDTPAWYREVVKQLRGAEGQMREALDVSLLEVFNRKGEEAWCPDSNTLQHSCSR